MYILNWISIIFVSVTCLVYWYFKVSFSYWKSRNVPHIAPTFPHGNIKGFGTEIHLIGGIKRIYDQLKGSGKFCGVYYYTSPHVVVLDLELAKTILNKDFHNFDDRGMYHNEKVIKNKNLLHTEFFNDFIQVICGNFYELLL